MSISVGLEGLSLLPVYKNYHDDEEEEDEGEEEEEDKNGKSGGFDNDAKKSGGARNKDLHGDSWYAETDPNMQEHKQVFENLFENICRWDEWMHGLYG